MANPSGTRRPQLKNSPENKLLQRRLLRDSLASKIVGLGGISVIFFITLIFFYLAYIVAPLFKPAAIEQIASYQLSATEGSTVQLSLDEQLEIGARFNNSGKVTFFRAATGETISETTLGNSTDPVTSYTRAAPLSGVIAYGTSRGKVIVAKVNYVASYPNNQRVITPTIDFPLGAEPIQADAEGRPIVHLALQENEEQFTLALVTADGRFLLTHMSKESSFLDDSASSWVSTTATVPTMPHAIQRILLDKSQTYLFAISATGELSSFDIRDKTNPQFIEHLRVTPNTVSVTAAQFLAGDLSLLIGDSSGNVAQWSMVRQDDNSHRLTRLREFAAFEGHVTALAPEMARKGYLAADDKGSLGIFHTTAHRTLLNQQLDTVGLRHLGIAPRADALLAEHTSGKITLWHIHNEHPEVSWSSLWGKVWYENYDEPKHIWQSSSASNDFEPKYSLVPLTFGTLKAAFYAMLLAIPIALCGALYTAQFMAPKMRRYVKPSIEIMEALPTVILGFLAGLWLAPYVELHLPGIIAILVLTPLGIVMTAYGWSLLPASLRLRIPDGWEAALLLPVIAFIIWLSVTLSPSFEAAFFGGDMRQWLTNEMGIAFDQRNAIIVGIAMGFAIIPLVFSIAEDAVFGVPKHLIQGSLALGATPWQTMVHVVLLTASPGIFSAVMIGLGRAVGETMIVLMATGNTPVMDFSPFQGLRTLSANIAVELPESEVNSTHFRILFLAGLVLLLFTFFVNTLAEIVRQRLRKKYSTL